MRAEEEIREALLAGDNARAWRLYGIHRVTADNVTAEVHYLGGRAALGLGDLHEARWATERATASGATGTCLGSCRLVLGETMRRIGSLAEAVEVLERFLADMDQYPDLGPLWQGAGWHNLGLAYRQLGRLDQAKRAYQHAAGEFRREGLRDYLGQVLWSLAWTLCLLGDASGAREALTESESVRRDDLGHWHQLLGWALVEATEGWQPSTTEICTRIMQATKAPPDVVAHAHWLCAREALRQGLFTEAMAMADRAVDVAAADPGENRAWRDAVDLRQAVLRALQERGQAAGA